MTPRTQLALAVVLLGIGGGATDLAAQPTGPDPLIGTWIFNPDQSDLPMVPESFIMTYEALADGRLQMTAEVRLPNGTQLPPQVQVFSDAGEDQPVQGGTVISSVSTERLGPRTLSLRFKNDAGSAVELMRLEVSEDGSTLTQTIRYIRPDGESQTVAVFDRR